MHARIGGGGGAHHRIRGKEMGTQVNVNQMTRQELEALPCIDYGDKGIVCHRLIVLPARPQGKHQQMSFVALDADWQPLGRIDAQCDTFHFDGVGGYGMATNNEPVEKQEQPSEAYMPPRGSWSMTLLAHSGLPCVFRLGLKYRTAKIICAPPFHRYFSVYASGDIGKATILIDPQEHSSNVCPAPFVTL